ncbi:MAG: hypothetical protein COB15_07815 [Flavobacteriales bacterium]|nr:MAG: hypothetical protein COB15_07815 [Flavobacteriales bacterium]
MTKFNLKEYRIQSTGADGGHNYIIAEVIHNNVTRRLVVMFRDKSDEKKLSNGVNISVEGNLHDEDIKQDLTLLDARLI